MTTGCAARYDEIADLYDELSPGDGHREWTARLIELAREHREGCRRVLDVGCGSGRSFGPLLAAGCSVVGVDVSAAMLEKARERHGHAVRLAHADMRDLPVLGTFDLALCLDDTLNHLPREADVQAAFAGCAANLDAGGLLLFDVVALGAYRSAADRIVERDDRLLLWRLPGAAELEPGDQVEMLVDVVGRESGDRWTRRHWSQPHRHHPEWELRRALRATGFEVVRRWGQLRGGVLDEEVDELRQHKVLVLARKL